MLFHMQVQGLYTLLSILKEETEVFLIFPINFARIYFVHELYYSLILKYQPTYKRITN